MNLSTLNKNYPKKILIGIQEGICNLKCPKCYTHGENKISENARARGIMDIEKLKKLLDEVAPYQPRIAPQTWDEPLLTPNILEYLREIKKRNLVITMDTNGLLLSDEMINSLVELEVDSVFISLDAFYSNTYLKVRGVDRLDFLIDRVLSFLKIRGDKKFPRIGVSFVKEKFNQNEETQFINFWKDKVDVIRVNQKFLEKRKLDIVSTEERTKCWSLDDSLMIHFNGEVALCCVDNHYENKIGNVFDNSVNEVWNGEYFNKMRALHEEKNWNMVGICKDCDLWAHEKPINSEDEHYVTSKTTTHTYINSKNKLSNLSNNNRFLRN
jgi:radical SAM protein with 4Fe4S-binding SPASM domain